MCIAQKAITEGGAEYAKSVLDKAFGEKKAEELIKSLYEYYCRHKDKLPRELLYIMNRDGEPIERIVCDHISAMSDRFAISLYEELYVPKSWALV